MNEGQFKDGHDNRRARGRSKGSKNNFTQIKDSFLEVFEELGGSKGLVEWVKLSPKNKTHFYQMIARMLPTKVIEESEKEIKNEGLQILIGDEFMPKIDMKKILESMNDND